MPRAELIQANVSDQDDIQDIEQEILSLAREFIFPIDRIRSHTRPRTILSPNTVDNPQDDLKIDPNRPLESRAHAFYRLVGFPVVDPANDRFYNPGFGRAGFIATLNQKRRANIDSGFNNSVLKELSDAREDYHMSERSIFERQDFVAAFYALTLSRIRPFQVLNDSKGPKDKDQQFYTVDGRDSEIKDLENRNPGLAEQISLARDELVNFSDGIHYLRPFMVDPRIEQTVDITEKPALKTKSKLVGVPFLLTEEARTIEPGVTSTTPLLEEIICARLADTIEDKAFLDDVRKVAENENTPSADLGTLDATTLRNTVFALLDNNQIDPSTILELNGITKTEVLQIIRFVKIIKVLIKRVNESIIVIQRARKKINWIPIPNRDGPELGAVGATLFRGKGTSISSPIDQNIAHLQVQELRANKRIACAGGENSNLSMVSNSSGKALDTFRTQKQKAINMRNRVATSAFKAMGDIEMIMGETTGFGLIDIVAITAALWAIDIEDLLGFLDDEAVSRLQRIPGLNTDAVENRTTNIFTSLEAFENQLINILDFAQKEFDRQKGSLVNSEGGSI